jgi:hypothetical protein
VSDPQSVGVSGFARAKCEMSGFAKCEMRNVQFREMRNAKCPLRNFAREISRDFAGANPLIQRLFSVTPFQWRCGQREGVSAQRVGVRTVGVRRACSRCAVSAQWARSGRAVGVRPACRHVRRCDETLFWPCLILHLLPRQAQDRHKGKLRNKQGRFLSAGLFRRDHRNRWERGDSERRGNSPLARAVFSPFWK